MTVLWLGRSVACLSPRRPWCDPRSVHVGFVVDKVALGQNFLPVLLLPLSVSLHQRSIFIFIDMLLLPGGQTGKGWEPCIKHCSFGNRGELDIKVVTFFFAYKALLTTNRWQKVTTRTYRNCSNCSNCSPPCSAHILQLPSTDLFAEHRFTGTHLDKGTSRTCCIFIFCRNEIIFLKSK